MKKTKGDVHWHLPKRKRPVAYSAKAVNDFIVMMAQKHETIQEIYDAINYDMDAKEILKILIDNGYGNAVARDLFK